MGEGEQASIKLGSLVNTTHGQSTSCTFINAHKEQSLEMRGLAFVGSEAAPYLQVGRTKSPEGDVDYYVQVAKIRVSGPWAISDFNLRSKNVML